jgi:hypothetical protein
MVTDRKFTEQEAAEFLGVKRRTLQDWRLLQKGPHYLKYDGGSIRYAESDLAEYLSRSLHATARGKGAQ